MKNFGADRPETCSAGVEKREEIDSDDNVSSPYRSAKPLVTLVDDSGVDGNFIVEKQKWVVVPSHSTKTTIFRSAVKSRYHYSNFFKMRQIC